MTKVSPSYRSKVGGDLKESAPIVPESALGATFGIPEHTISQATS